MAICSPSLLLSLLGFLLQGSRAQIVSAVTVSAFGCEAPFCIASHNDRVFICNGDLTCVPVTAIPSSFLMWSTEGDPSLSVIKLNLERKSCLIANTISHKISVPFLTTTL